MKKTNFIDFDGEFPEEREGNRGDDEADRELYKEKKLPGGHIILLNPKGTKEYELDKIQALEALKTYSGGMQIGGGIDEENAEEFVSAGASHIIMTSRSRSEERRVGKECRSRWSPYH